MAWAPDHPDYDKQPAVVRAAIVTLMDLGGADGAHRKQFALDQVLRVLTECPAERRTATDYKGVEFEYTALGESPLYLAVVEGYCHGEDGPETYDWDEGIAP